ncbi:hypothetical protein D2E43_14115 [Mycobacteroides abscessus]|nr:hypothetical protein D2E43_14115 [Mycobacteroides abscessus]
MSPQPDVIKPINDPYSLIGGNWPVELESAYHAAEDSAHDASTRASVQAQSATDAESKMADEKGRAADAVSGGYSNAASQLHEQSISYATIGSWMNDAASKVRTAKTDISDLVTTGTRDIRDALGSEIAGTPVTPSSSALIDQYRGQIASVAMALTVDLDAIGHSLAGGPGASTTPTYVRAVPTPTAPTIEQVVHHGITGEGPSPVPHELPPMPRATTTPTAEPTSAPGTPVPTASPHSVNPTLGNLVAGSAPSGTPSSPSISSTKSPSTPSGTPAGQGAQASQPTEQHQNVKSSVLPRIPSIGLPDLPAAAQTIATTITSAAGHQLATTAPSTPGSSLPASTGITPGTSGVAPMPPAGLAPIGGLTPPPVMQAAPVSQASPAVPTPGVQTPSPQSPPSAPRGPVADMAWLQRTYGLAPGLDLPKPENHIAPMLFIADMAESEAQLHRALATLRHAFDDAGWGQPMTVARIKRGLETRTVYATSDGLSIWPQGVQLPSGVIPLDEMPGTPVAPELCGSLMVTDKLTSLIPRGWEVEGVLSSVSGEEGSQSTEQYQALVSAGELLDCKVSRGREGVTDDEALSTFARASIGSTGVGELDVESARIRASRWVGTQPRGYLDTLARYYLSDAAESMSRGNWGEAVYASEKYMSIRSTEKQVA